jgi:hypothetical protein
MFMHYVASLGYFVVVAGDERTCAAKELPTARWRRERRCRDKLGDYTKLQQNKTTSVRYCINPYHLDSTYSVISKSKISLHRPYRTLKIPIVFSI